MVGPAGFATVVYSKCETGLEDNPPSEGSVNCRQSSMRGLQSPPERPEDTVAENQSLVYWFLAT